MTDFQSRRPPDWSLPPGVSPGLWEYVRSEELARYYLTNASDSPVPAIDSAFVARHLTPPGRVLDLGCGVGRSLIPLAQRGFEAVGVDLSEAMLNEARTNAEQVGVRLHLVRANIVELDALQSASFDYCLCMFGTLGMISGAANRQRVLAHVHRLVRAGGLFLVHVHNRHFEIWTAEGRKRLIRDCWAALRGRETGERILPPHQGVANLYMHLFSRTEVIRCLERANLKIVDVQPLSLRTDGQLRASRWLGDLRAFGYLLAARI